MLYLEEKWNMWMYKRKFKISKKGKAKRITEMDKSELTKMIGLAAMMANACGFADDGAGQNMWIGIEGECKTRLEAL